MTKKKTVVKKKKVVSVVEPVVEPVKEVTLTQKEMFDHFVKLGIIDPDTVFRKHEPNRGSEIIDEIVAERGFIKAQEIIPSHDAIDEAKKLEVEANMDDEGILKLVREEMGDKKSVVLSGALSSLIKRRRGGGKR